MVNRKKFLIVFCFLFFLPFLNAEVPIVLSIPNTAPYLINNIPNQSCIINDSILNAFDLDNYFEDANGDFLNFYYLPTINITINIDSENLVSFYPGGGFAGYVSTFFIASDGMYNATSNEVFISVGQDSVGPSWSNATISNSTVYQNDYLNFSVWWNDNFGLRDYYFSANQGSGWVNYSLDNFSGMYNQSFNRVQISAAPGSNLLWKVCARDTSYNLNCMTEQIIQILIKDVSGEDDDEKNKEDDDPAKIKEGITALVVNDIDDFSFSPDFYKISLKQGSTETRILKISNVGNTKLSFELFAEGLEEFVLFSEKVFELNFGDKKEITLDFVAGKSLLVDQYFGKIVISSFENQEIPVVIDVNALELSFGVEVNLSEEYKLVKPGKTIEADLQIRSLKDRAATNIILTTELKDFQGNIYSSQEEELILTDVLNMKKTLEVPEDVRGGNYLFYAKVTGADLIAIDSAVFEVGSRFNFAAFFKASSILIFIGILIFLILILLIRYSREKKKEKLLSLYLMLSELKNLIKEGKTEQAISLYIRVKKIYGEPVSKSVLENKEKLKEEILKLASKLKKEIPKKVEEEGKKKLMEGEKEEKGNEERVESQEGNSSKQEPKKVEGDSEENSNEKKEGVESKGDDSQEPKEEASEKKQEEENKDKEKVKQVEKKKVVKFQGDTPRAQEPAKAGDSSKQDLKFVKKEEVKKKVVPAKKKEVNSQDPKIVKKIVKKPEVAKKVVKKDYFKEVVEKEVHKEEKKNE